MAKKLQKNDLGLGIRALLKGVDEATPAEQAEVVRTLAHSVAMIPIEEIEVNPYQPRKEFDQEALEELATSLRTYGLIQPVTVRRLSEGAFQLISGERRFRAAKLAGLSEVPAYVRLADDQEMLEMALVENIQREELNAIEVAISYQRLIDECQLTHEKMSERVGKQRSTITNHLRLLKLPPDIQGAIKERKLSMGHARALAGIQDYGTMDLLFKKTLAEDLSVRALEGLIRSYSQVKSKGSVSSEQIPDSYKKVEQNFKSFFGSGKLKIKLSGQDKGQILIPFDSVDELNSLLDRIDA
jgi:ParB family transcriptional regulator, chromosome partitioning protein